jgi:predicted protein tyrosine phosphatase
MDWKICGVEELKRERLWATHVVSLYAPGFREEVPFLAQGARCVLKLDFDDTDRPEGMQPLSGRPWIPPSSEDVAGIIRFGKRVPERARLLVHCQAGISRSTAAMFAILCARQPGEDPRVLLTRIWRKRWQAWPNALMVAYADALLHRQGEMKRALEWFRQEIKGGGL